MGTTHRENQPDPIWPHIPQTGGHKAPSQPWARWGHSKVGWEDLPGEISWKRPKRRIDRMLCYRNPASVRLEPGLQPINPLFFMSSSLPSSRLCHHPLQGLQALRLGFPCTWCTPQWSRARVTNTAPEAALPARRVLSTQPQPTPTAQLSPQPIPIHVWRVDPDISVPFTHV